MDAKMKDRRSWIADRGLQIVDCRSWIADRGSQIVDRESKGSWAARPHLYRSWDILSQSVLGASCSKSKAANEPASSSNPPHFDVQCWMFNVRCSFSLSPKYLNLQSSNVFSPFFPNNL
jgi:hypothetical protein